MRHRGSAGARKGLDRFGEVGDSESKPFWTKFLRSLRARGLNNVQLVISDSHSDLAATIRTIFAQTTGEAVRT